MDNPKWFDNRKKRVWIDDIFQKLGHYYNEFIDDIAEIPFGYSERSLVGHLAIEAHDCCYYTLQDFEATMGKEPKKGEKNRYRPDLWLTMEPRPNSRDYLVEVKRKEIPIDIDGDRLGDAVDDKLSEAQELLPEKTREQRAKWSCALVALQIQCAKTKWKKYKIDDSRSYNRRCEEVLEVINNVNWDDCKNKPDFCFYYWIPFKNQVGNLKKCLWKKEPPGMLGVLCFGSFQEVEKNPV